jgi:hypothetical protein
VGGGFWDVVLTFWNTFQVCKFFLNIFSFGLNVQLVQSDDYSLVIQW